MSALVRSRKTCGNTQPKFQCSFRCGFPDASWFGCGGYQGDEGNADAQHHNPIPLPWDHYGYRAVTFTLGISSRLERVFY